MTNVTRNSKSSKELVPDGITIVMLKQKMSNRQKSYIYNLERKWVGWSRSLWMLAKLSHTGQFRFYRQLRSLLGLLPRKLYICRQKHTALHVIFNHISRGLNQNNCPAKYPTKFLLLRILRN